MVNTTEKVAPSQFSKRVFGSVFLSGSQTISTPGFSWPSILNCAGYSGARRKAAGVESGGGVETGFVFGSGFDGIRPLVASRR
jgi:hypothetical protein